MNIALFLAKVSMYGFLGWKLASYGIKCQTRRFWIITLSVVAIDMLSALIVAL